MESQARYGRRGFLNWGKGGQLKLTERAVEFRTSRSDELGPPEMAFPFEQIARVSREGYVIHFPLWQHVILFATPLAQSLAWMLSGFIKNWLEIRTIDGRKYPFGLRGGAPQADEWVAAINERRRSRLQTG